MGLLELLGVTKKQRIVVNAPTSHRDDLDRLTAKGELPFGWVSANKEFVQKIEAEYKSLSDEWYSSRKKGVMKEYATLKSLVLYMEDVKGLCDSKGECFAEWASIMVADPITYKQRKERLAYIEANLETLLAKEKEANA